LEVVAEVVADGVTTIGANKEVGTYLPPRRI
jgi:hypothetical protein